ncbi:threonylcarbamoyl-AMP synthase [Dissulfurirhabdus thermomarina]|uniref:L-threonylcarbamoyladenylate synthase n=1 Tax=Dissulfurirhabdus thermomarina TaxID=1765737 RepID=A0A6N9TP69_DISTH|nr:L-threonylcarbamoyladenylate synthase [Dissulfurirhabdus thermomarina]NDY42848.1 threonylcarbamoyl-AMP synthase [Dissulfurirhabdus thermomarina]NMX23246.1 threonylcarbamoyl-AMP synthase [Dissulfurirhabdus thermomarina]
MDRTILGTSVEAAAGVLAGGGVVAYPTETTYGLGARLDRPAALDRVFRLKRRPLDKPLLVLVASRADLERLVVEIPPAAEDLMHRFWPGPLTLLLPARADLPRAVTADTGKVGVRISSHPVAAALAAAAGVPVTATSANRSGEPPALTAGEVVERFGVEGETLAYVLDGGRTPGGLPSTIVDVGPGGPRLVRPGAVPEGELGI